MSHILLHTNKALSLSYTHAPASCDGIKAVVLSHRGLTLGSKQ